MPTTEIYKKNIKRMTDRSGVQCYMDVYLVPAVYTDKRVSIHLGRKLIYKGMKSFQETFLFHWRGLFYSLNQGLPHHGTGKFGVCRRIYT